jgi:hypothetical protein
MYAAAIMQHTTQGFAYKALLRLEEDRVADGVGDTDAVLALVEWATEQQADEDSRLSF